MRLCGRMRCCWRGHGLWRCTGRKAGSWVEADPTETGEVSLHPTVSIVPLHNPYLALRIKVSLAKTVYHPSRNTQQAGHHHHSTGIVGAVATTALEQPINNIDIARD